MNIYLRKRMFEIGLQKVDDKMALVSKKKIKQIRLNESIRHKRDLYTHSNPNLSLYCCLGVVKQNQNTLVNKII